MEQPDSQRVAKDAPLPAYLQLADIIRARIQAGELPPGKKLPSERELMQAQELSRGTVRDALNQLRIDGLITVQHGRGAFVAEPITKIALPLPDLTDDGPPATYLRAIRAAGHTATARPLGPMPGTNHQGPQTAVIIFADATPIALWHATVQGKDTSWPGSPEDGIHSLFPPLPKATLEGSIKVGTATPDERRLLMLEPAAQVMHTDVDYTSRKGSVISRTALPTAVVQLRWNRAGTDG